MSWIQTYTGKKFYPLDPRVEDIDIEDIAHSLSMQCRYNGHCTSFYSVAEHCVLLSHAVDPEHALTALLHDAAEAYLSDIPRPIKPHLEGFRERESALDHAIAEKFGLPYPWPEQVKDYDFRILFDERADIMRPCEHDWEIEGEPLGVRVEGWLPDLVKILFLARFSELSGES